MSQPKQPTNSGALATLVIVFFFWGFIAASNSIFIPFCRTHFQLNQFQSQLIGSAFYGAYFMGSLALYLFSSVAGYDILNKIGYKRGIVIGLLISVVGALLIIPSANMNSFPAILGSFFIVALGFSLQQTAAQPFAIALGDPSTGTHRLNFAGGVNSLGTTLGPIIVSYFLFGTPSASNANVTVTNINTLYMIVAAVFADEPRHRVVDLVGIVDARLSDGILLIDKRQEVELRIERRLILSVGVEVGIGERHIFLREVDAQGIEAVATEHRVERRDQRLIDVVLLA